MPEKITSKVPVVEKEQPEAVKAADTAVDTKAKGTTLDAAEATPKIAKKKKAKRHVAVGQVHILATFNNTIVSVTDNKGSLLTSASAGSCGFRGSKKGTAYAAQVAGEKAIGDAKQLYGIAKADVYVKGIGLGRDAAIRSVSSNNIAIESIKDVTSVPHGGCRPRKARRV